jgi:dihydrofolate synthase/folylpolyglutamate synthase
MRMLTNFDQVNAALARFVPTGIVSGNYTLETMKKLMTYLGNPQDSLKVIHIAGTSGKTSTAYYVTSLLKGAGYSTGLSISPHIHQVSERAQIDLMPLVEQDYCVQLSEFIDLVYKSGLEPSHFELMVAFAYWLFHRRKVDYAVIEVGLGGLLDGTNVVTSPDKICVITDIGFDHVEILGDTLAKITAQKAGIIHQSNDVFMYQQSDEVMDVVNQVIQKRDARLHAILPKKGNAHADLPPFQIRNFFLAKTVVEFTLKRDGKVAISDSQEEKASLVHIPGRMDVQSYHGKTLIMDGAHNEQKITALVEAVKAQFVDQDITMLVAFGQNKQASVSKSLSLLRQLGSTIIVTQFMKGQDEVRTAIDPDELANLAKQAGFRAVTVEPNPINALQLLQQSDTAVNLIAGSFYLLENYQDIIL